MGDRNEDLTRLVDSLASEDFDGVLVGNGVAPPSYSGWRTFDTETNIGISAGRGLGARHATSDVLVFIDDDCRNLTPTLLGDIADAFSDDPNLGALAMRVVVAGTDESLSEWQPRLQGRGERLPGEVTSFHGAAHAVRASVYHDVGGYPDELFYAHEETDLAWRLLDAGFTIRYRPDLVLEHPLTKPSRHQGYLWYSARNRVWMARRSLPVPLLVSYLGVWALIQSARCRSLGELAAVARGTWQGLRHSPLPRAPMSWATAWRMTRLGRPPII